MRFTYKKNKFILLSGTIVFILISCWSTYNAAPIRDEIKYLSIKHSSNYITREFKRTHIPPLLPLIIKESDKLGIPPKLAGSILMICSGIVVTIMVYMTTNALFNDTLFSSVSYYISIFHYYIVFSASHILRDFPYLAIFSLAIYCGVNSYKTGNLHKTCIYAIMAYIIAPLGAVFRREAFELLVLLDLLVICTIFKNIRQRKTLLYIGLGAGGTMIYLFEIMLLSILFRKCGYDWTLYSSCLNRIDYIRRCWNLY